MIWRIGICLFILLIVSNTSFSVKVSTTGYHIVHNEHTGTGSGFHGYKYSQPLALPLTG